MKWPILALMLVACSGEGDELEAPILGDCAHCSTAPSAGGSSSSGDGGVLDANDDESTFDASDLVDVGVPSDI